MIKGAGIFAGGTVFGIAIGAVLGALGVSFVVLNELNKSQRDFKEARTNRIAEYNKKDAS